MVPPFYIIWDGPAGELHSFNVMTGAWQDNPLTYGVCFPGDTTVSQNVTLTGSGLRRRSYETLVNTSLFLAGDTATLAAIQGWAQVSFDEGATFQPLTTLPLLIPGIAMGRNGVDGQIGPFDTAGFLVNVVIPKSYSQYRTLNFRIAVDCDVI